MVAAAALLRALNVSFTATRCAASLREASTTGSRQGVFRIRPRSQRHSLRVKPCTRACKQLAA